MCCPRNAGQSVFIYGGALPEVISFLLKYEVFQLNLSSETVPSPREMIWTWETNNASCVNGIASLFWLSRYKHSVMFKSSSDYPFFRSLSGIKSLKIVPITIRKAQSDNANEELRLRWFSRPLMWACLTPITTPGIYFDLHRMWKI